MKTFKIAATIVAASISAFIIAPTLAQGHAVSSMHDHYEWRSGPQFGPRAPLRASRRVWVSKGAQVAGCDCGVMKMSSADAISCMKDMSGMASPSGTSAS